MNGSVHAREFPSGNILEQGGTSEMAAGALLAALANRGMDASELDSHYCRDGDAGYVLPIDRLSCAAKVGAKTHSVLNLNAACSGFVYALVVGAQFIEGGPL